MNRYFFDLHNGSGIVPDEEGRALPTRESVEAEVGRILTDVARDELPDHALGVATVVVRDDSGGTICVGSLSFSKSWLS